MYKILVALLLSSLFAQISFAQNNLMASAHFIKGSAAPVVASVSEKPLLALRHRSHDAGSAVQMQLAVTSLLDGADADVSVKVYFSNDPIFDFKDELLENFVFEKTPTDVNGRLWLSFELPRDIETGQYHLLVVAQTEEGVLLSKTCSTTIWVSGQKE